MKNLKRVCSLFLILCVAMGLYGTALAAGGFMDVLDSAAYAEAVAYVRDQGLMVGTGADTFSPDSAITRGQAAAILYRAAGSPAVTSGTAFPDVADTDYYAAVIAQNAVTAVFLTSVLYA